MPFEDVPLVITERETAWVLGVIEWAHRFPDVARWVGEALDAVRGPEDARTLAGILAKIQIENPLASKGLVDLVLEMRQTEETGEDA